MSHPVLIANQRASNRGDQPRSGAATQPKYREGVALHGDLATEACHV